MTSPVSPTPGSGPAEKDRGAAARGVRGLAARWLDSHMREVVRGAAIALPLRVLGAGIGFALNLLLARLLGVDDTGVYYLALTVTYVASTISMLGMETVLVRHTAAEAERGDFATLKAVARTGTRLPLTCAIALTVMLVAAAPWICEDLLGKPELTRPLQWMALTIVPQTQLRLHAQLLRGLKKIAVSQMLRNVDVPFLTLVFIALLGGAYGATGAAWSFMAANLITAMAAAWLWRRAAGPGETGESAMGVRDLLRSGLPILQTNVLNMVFNPLTTLLLGAMSSSSSVALYAIAFRTALLTRFALMAVNAIAAPKFAALHGMADGAALSSTSRRSSLLITLTSLPMLFCFIVFPHWTMGLFGPAFAEGAELLRIIAIGQFTAVMSGSVGFLLMMSGHERILRNNALAAGAVCIVLNLALIPTYGATGAAIAVAVAIVVRSLLGTLQVYRCLGILPFFIQAPATGRNDE